MRNTSLILAARGIPALSNGFLRLPTNEVVAKLIEGDYYLGPRYRLEEDETFLQLIPYVIVTDGTRFLSYTRSPHAGEARLHGKRAFGFGGHLSVGDMVFQENGSLNIVSTIRCGARRELNEELEWRYDDGQRRLFEPADLAFVGFVAACRTPVDRVHLGVVMLATTPGPLPTPYETGIAKPVARDSEIASLDTLKGDDPLPAGNWETWSEMIAPLLPQLLKDRSAK